MLLDDPEAHCLFIQQTGHLPGMKADALRITLQEQRLRLQAAILLAGCSSCFNKSLRAHTHTQHSLTLTYVEVQLC